MALDYKKKIGKLLEVYTLEELAAIIGVTGRSISYYKDGESPSKKAKPEIDELFKKVSENGFNKIRLEDLKKRPSTKQISEESVLLKLLIQEFAEYKALKEGLNPDQVVKDIENKAKLILEVSSKF